MNDLQQQLDKFFQDNDRGYPRDPRKLAYKKLQKNTQGMDREQAERMTPASTTIRIMRSPHMDADVPVDDATKAMIDCIKNMPKK